MTMEIDRKLIDQIETLARLQLTEREKETLQEQLTRILDHVETIEELDLEDVDPLTHPLDLENVQREDQVEDGISVDEALQNAPERTENFFSVPRVFDGD